MQKTRAFLLPAMLAIKHIKALSAIDGILSNNIMKRWKP